MAGRGMVLGAASVAALLAGGIGYGIGHSGRSSSKPKPAAAITHGSTGAFSQATTTSTSTPPATGLSPGTTTTTAPGSKTPTSPTTTTAPSTGTATAPSTGTTTAPSTSASTTVPPTFNPPAQLAWVQTGGTWQELNTTTGQTQAGPTINEVAIAPDHSRVAALESGQIVVGSTAIPAPNASHVVWSQDGQHLAWLTLFQVQGSPPEREVTVVNADGSGLRQLTQGAAADDVSPAWSPDGRTIAFTINNGDVIRFADVITGQMTLYTIDTGAHFRNLVWLPSGIVAEVSNEIDQLTPDGTSLRRVTPPGTAAIAFSVSRDQQTVAYTGADGGLWTVPLSGGHVRSLGAPSVAIPAWSGDGQYLLTASASGTRVVRVADASTKVVHTGADTGAAW